ncbi:histidine kinase [Nakamurella sp.]|uniref:histidine kinase n=1 Tax=Nakamurella sp. TaxID=1869182 RepID=UPI003782F15B
MSRASGTTTERVIPGAGLRDALLGIAALMSLLVLVELAVPSTAAVSAASVLDAIAVAAYTVTGLVAWRRRPHNRTGRLMVAVAAGLLVAGMSDDDLPALRFVGQVTESLPLAMLIHLLLAYPSGRLDGRPARITVAAGYAVALGLQYPQRLLDPDAADTLWNVQAGLGLITLVAAFVLVSRRLATAPPPVRRHLAPFILAGCLMLAVVVGSLFVLHFDPEPDAADLAVLAQVAAVSILPAAFVVGMLGGAFGRAGELEELALGIADASAEPELLDALAVRALGDPSARVRWTVDGGLVAGDGRPVDPAAERTGSRGWCPIGPAGAPVGGLSYDRSLIADPALVTGATAPLALAMDHRRLVVDLRAAVRQLDAAADQLRDSRRRIVVAADGERRRIARDLHDGPQQRIVLIGIEAQRIGRRADDPGFVRQVSGTVSEQLRLLLDDLRSLVHGIMPGTLTERGLPAAIAVLAEGIPVPVEVRIDPGIRRLPAEVESTGYFVVAEALTNAVKHGAASRIWIGVRITGGRLEVDVTDDGVGPGSGEPGFGLRSLADRVAALDGTVTLRPGPGRGTTLRAEFACA